jgi:hypothetical protein
MKTNSEMKKSSNYLCPKILTEVNRIFFVNRTPIIHIFLNFLYLSCDVMNILIKILKNKIIYSIEWQSV